MGNTVRVVSWGILVLDAYHSLCKGDLPSRKHPVKKVSEPCFWYQELKLSNFTRWFQPQIQLPSLGAGSFLGSFFQAVALQGW